LGLAAILEGRFASAFETLQLAEREERPLGLDGEMTQTLDELRGVAEVAASPAEVQQFTERLADALDSFGMAGGAASARYELALLRRTGGACPDPEAALGKVPAG